jgi:DNA topoisomerase-1
VHAVQALSQLAPAGSQAEAKRNVVQVIEAVAAQLGNTKAVCRKCYIHPAVLETYLEDGFSRPLKGSAAVAGVVALLQARLKREARDARHSGAGGRSLEPVLTRSLNKLRRAANGRGAAASAQTV